MHFRKGTTVDKNLKKQAVVRKQKAMQLLKKGRFRDAKDTLKRLCRTSRDDIEAWFLLSVACGNLGEFDKVIKACREILRTRPDYPPALSNMGNALSALGRHDKAAPYLERALKIEPDNPVTLNNYGQALLLAEHADKAIEPLLRSVALRPDYAEAHSNLGQALDGIGRLSDAISHYREAVRLNPGLFEGWMRLADELALVGALPEAKQVYHKALGIRNEPQVGSGLAGVLLTEGNLEGALEVYEQVSETWPDDATGLAGVADILERMGRLDEAYDRIQSIVKHEQVTATVADVFCRLCRHFLACDQAIEVSRRLIEDGRLSAGERQVVHHALGKILDRFGEYDAAFEEFHQANALAPSRYDPTEETARCDQLIAAFDRDSLARLPRARQLSERPVFIIGMPRSGTTLVEQILSSHRHVHGAGELVNVGFAVSELRTQLERTGGYPAAISTISQELVDQMAESYLKHIESLSNDAWRITDKMPHNFRYLGLIAILFPQARVIHCRRDAMDTCLSIYFQFFNRTHNYATDLDALGHFYGQYSRLMAHWKSVLDIPILDVNYEKLIADSESVSRSMVDFCGLDWDEQCLSFHKSERWVATASYDQVRQPIYTQSVGRWRNYEKYLEPLTRALGVDS